MTGTAVNLLARDLKILSDENRLKIIELLGSNELCVCHIYESLGLPQNLVSHHLQVLRKAGMVIADKKGKWIYYRTDMSKLKDISNMIKGLH